MPEPNLPSPGSNRRRKGRKILGKQKKSSKAQNFIADVTERKALARSLLDAAEREQRRIGRDLHDGLCQMLFGLSLKAQSLAASLKKLVGAPADEADKMARLLEQAIDQARNVVRGLHPAGLESGGIVSVLQELANSVEGRMSCTVRCPAGFVIEDREQSLHLYRIAQEAVHNAIRHSGGKHVTISLRRAPGEVILEVSDDGKGFKEPVATGASGTIGLASIKYRADAIGAKLSIVSASGKGTTVRCRVPEPSASGPAAGRHHHEIG